MKRKWLPGLLVCILIAASLVGACGPTPTPTPTPVEPIVLKHAAMLAPPHYGPTADMAWMEKIEEETGGRVRFEAYWGGTLLTPTECVTELADGVYDTCHLEIWVVTTGCEIMQTMGGWFFKAPSPEIAISIFHQAWDKFPEIRAELPNIKPLVIGSMTKYHLHTVKPVRTLEDLKGLQIRTMASFVPVFKALGADPVTIPGSEVYASLQKGIVDGAFFPYEAIKSQKLDEVVEYSTKLDLIGPVGVFCGMNLDTWNSLPSDIQKVIEDSLQSWETMYVQGNKEADQAGFDAAAQAGVEFIELPTEDLNELYAVTSGQMAKEAERLDASGYPGTEIYNEVMRLIELSR